MDVVTVTLHEQTEQTRGFCDIIDITLEVREALAEAGLHHSLVSLFVPGSTAALTTVEHEPGLVKDLAALFERLIPSDRRCHHDRRDDDNGFSHLRAVLVGPSLQAPAADGRPRLGTWQQIVLADFDNRPRRREILVQFMGGAA